MVNNITWFYLYNLEKKMTIYNLEKQMTKYCVTQYVQMKQKAHAKITEMIQQNYASQNGIKPILLHPLRPT